MPGLGHGFRPNMFDHLVLDLDGDNVSGNDGDSIATWPNAAPTGSGNDATQGTGGSQPILKKTSNGINGHNVLRFDGTKYMNGSYALGSTGVTVFFVAKTGGSLNLYGTVLHASENPAHADWAISLGSGADTFQAGWGGPNANIGLGSNTLATATVYRGTASYDKVNWNLSGTWITNTVADTSFPTASPVNYHVGVWFSGGVPGVPGVFLIGDIARILVINVTLTAAQIAAVEQFLKTKYAIS
jgi:hypothetical protein